MAELVIDGDDLVVRLTRWQKAMAAHGDVRVPLSAVRRVGVPDSKWLALRGWRSTGLNVPGKASFGTRRHGDGYDFVAVSGAHDEAVCVELNGQRFGQLVVSADDAPAVADRVAAAAGIHR
ncbi:MAG TPA: hypothetical protein VFP61_03080 [Acidimicrobiales bacterium]|nr:hypothetical protein [Acidimicrobiales bacterium]